MSNLLKKEKGFTLIEIVLVLAIAGLLLVIVFLAVQGAQRSRRDTQRKHDAAIALAGVESCASNHDGQYTLCKNQAQLVSGANTYITQTSPIGATYSVTTTAPTADGQLYVQTGTCPGATSGTMAVSVWQEAGAPYCVHN